jgi:hypothetical protein
VAEKAALTSSFLRHKLQEYQKLKAEIESLSQEMAISDGLDLGK